MNSNFEFCSNYWPDLSALGQLAENYLYTDSNACIIKIGMMAENILLKIFDYEKIGKPSITTSLNLTKILKSEGLLPKNVEDSLYIIRKARNNAVHANYGSVEEAKKLLKIAYNLCNWFMVVYGDWKYNPVEFVLPKETNDLEAIQSLEKQVTELNENEDVMKTLSSEIPVEKRLAIGNEASDKMMQLDPENQKIVENEKIRIEANVIPMVNYAMTQNKVRVIDNIYLKNNTSEAIEDVEIAVESNPSFFEPFVYNVSYIPENGDITVNDLKLHINMDYLINLTEKVSGDLTIKIRLDGKELNKEIYDVSLLAYDQWNGLSVYPELLCAFVTPNHDLISNIVSDSIALLDKWTRNPSIDAYQSGDKNRVRFQAAAIYGAIQQLNIAYSEAPASFGVGQRIRLTETIVQKKLGNCLDLTLLYASCLESIGIHPLLILKEGHAFLGYWLRDTTLTEVITDDQSMLTKRIADGVNDIRVVECTGLCYKSNVSYEEAENLGVKELDEVDFQCVIDVKCARLNNILPVTTRTIINNNYKPKREETNIDKIATAPQVLNALNDDEEIKESEKEYTKQTQWERKLLDLGLRNKLINMHLNSSIVPILTDSVEELENQLSDKGKFRILPKPLDYKPSEKKDDFEAISDLGDFKKFIQSEFDNGVLHTPLTETLLQKSMTSLSRKARTSLEENGANSLFLAIGLLKWCEQKKTTAPHYAPILLYPVDIKKKASVTEYTLTIRDEEPQINISLLEKLNQDYDLNIDGLDELPSDDSGLDVKRILTIFRKGIINQKYWDVLESAYLGIFSFSSFVMWNDLHSRYDDISKNKIVKSLVDQKISWDIYETDENSLQYKTYFPVPLDASQLSAVTEATKGKSFILHGPPGTGKSQTITALIANALGNGKKVLFVAEKRAALEVVQERLEKIGLGPFCLEMHSNKTNKTAILEHLRETEEIKKITPPNAYAVKKDKLERDKEQLDQYVQELHKKKKNGLSLYEAINNFEKYASYPDMKDVVFDKPELITFEELEKKYTVIRSLVAAGRKTGHPSNHPLQRVKLDEYNPKLRDDIETQCGIYENSIFDFFGTIDGFANDVSFGEIYEYDKCLEALDLAKKLSKFRGVPEEWAQVENADEFYNTLIKLSESKSKEQSSKSKLLSEFNEKILVMNVSEMKSSELIDVLKENYKDKILSANDVLKLSMANLDEAEEEFDCIDNLMNVMNELDSIKNSPLKSVGLSDTSHVTRQKVDSIVKSYGNNLKDLLENLKSLAQNTVMDQMYESDLSKYIEFVYMLKDFETIPRMMAKQKDISMYLADIERMALASMGMTTKKSELEQKWNSQFFDFDAEVLSNEYNKISASGIFSKLLESGTFKKKLSVYYKGELDKNNIKQELATFVEYQKEKNIFDELFDKYGKDLGYLYTGSQTDWNEIINLCHVILEKSKKMDDLLNDPSIRCNCVGNKENIPLVNKIIEIYEIVNKEKEEFNMSLNISDDTSEDWIRNDLTICEFIKENKEYVGHWIEYKYYLEHAKQLGLDESVALLHDSEDVAFLDSVKANSFKQELSEYQDLRANNTSESRKFESFVSAYSNDLVDDWSRIKELACQVKELICNFDKESKLKDYRIKYAGKEDLNVYFDSLDDYKLNYETEQKKFYALLRIDDLNDSEWYKNETDLCGIVSDQLDNLREWTIFNQTSNEAIEAGLKPVVDNYLSGISHDDLLNAYKRAYYKSLVESIISRSKVLNSFSGGMFEEKVKQFKQLDQEIQEIDKTLIFNNILSNVPNFEEEAAKSSEISILNRAIQTKGRRRSLRKLFSQLPTLITRICPCMLMSPLSVAQYLDPEQEMFDLIVFDEASQLQTCKAIGAIARAKNAVIVGDPKQMPPTNFFTSNTFDEEHEDIEDLESILDDCLGIKMPSKHLIWHYRSTHESLIAFSNNRFYENKLLTFPSFNDRDSKIQYVKLRGIFDRGKKRTNRVEAEAIVEELKRRCNDPALSKDSVGVVTFNTTQQDLIEDLISEECEKNKKFDNWIHRNEEYSVFVKNLENIQGDERDVILFSVCYGPDARGKTMMNFGPLNKEGGWRRLNVAISRARKEMVVYTSLSPEEITLTKTEGVAALKGFLEFARSGNLNLTTVDVNKEKYNHSEILDSICVELKNKGYECMKYIGHSDYRVDIGVINPKKKDEYLLGILIDGPNYKIAENTRDREIAQTMILKQLGWNIYRLWSLDWWNNKTKVIQIIENRLQNILNNGCCEPVDEVIEVEEKNIVEEPILNNNLVDKKDKTLSERLCDTGSEVIQKLGSKIIWVIYEEDKAEAVELLLKEVGARFVLSSKGTVVTDYRKAYRIMDTI